MKKATIAFGAFYWLFASMAISQSTVADSTGIEIKHPLKLIQIGNDRRVESLTTTWGSIYSTGDSSIVFALSTDRFHAGITPSNVIPVNKIWEIEHKNNPGKAVAIALVSGISGMIIGGIAGHASRKGWKSTPNNDHGVFSNDPTLPTILGAAGGGFLGFTLGWAIASGEKKVISIRGEQRRYDAQRGKLKLLSITGQ